jgi:YVTN family beta-propeller protein
MLDSNDYSIISTQDFPAAPHGLTLDPLRNRLYAGLMGEGQIVALDADTLAVTARVTLGGLGYPLDLALDEANGRLYVAHELAPKYAPSLSSIPPT